MKKLFFMLTIVGLCAFASCKSSESKSQAGANDSIADTTQVDTTIVK